MERMEVLRNKLTENTAESRPGKEIDLRFSLSYQKELQIIKACGVGQLNMTLANNFSFFKEDKLHIPLERHQ